MMGATNRLRQTGSFLLFALMVVAICTLFLTTGAMQSSTNLLATQMFLQSAQAHAAAEAGIDYALNQVLPLDLSDGVLNATTFTESTPLLGLSPAGQLSDGAQFTVTVTPRNPVPFLDPNGLPTTPPSFLIADNDLLDVRATGRVSTQGSTVIGRTLVMVVQAHEAFNAAFTGITPPLSALNPQSLPFLQLTLGSQLVWHKVISGSITDLLGNPSSVLLSDRTPAAMPNNIHLWGFGSPLPTAPPGSLPGVLEHAASLNTTTPSSTSNPLMHVFPSYTIPALQPTTSPGPTIQPVEVLPSSVTGSYGEACNRSLLPQSDPNYLNPTDWPSITVTSSGFTALQFTQANPNNYQVPVVCVHDLTVTNGHIVEVPQGERALVIASGKVTVDTGGELRVAGAQSNANGLRLMVMERDPTDPYLSQHPNDYVRFSLQRGGKAHLVLFNPSGWVAMGTLAGPTGTPSPEFTGTIVGQRLLFGGFDGNATLGTIPTLTHEAGSDLLTIAPVAYFEQNVQAGGGSITIGPPVPPPTPPHPSTLPRHLPSSSPIPLVRVISNE